MVDGELRTARAAPPNRASWRRYRTPTISRKLTIRARPFLASAKYVPNPRHNAFSFAVTRLAPGLNTGKFWCQDMWQAGLLSAELVPLLAFPLGSGGTALPGRLSDLNSRALKGGLMAAKVLFDEFHVSVFLRARMLETEIAAARRVLRQERFHKRLAQVVRAVFREEPVLRRLIIRISR